MKNTLLLFLFTFMIIGCRSDEITDENQQNQENENLIELKTNYPTFISQIQVDYEGEIIKTNNDEILLYGMLIGENENLTIESNQGNQTKEYSNGDKIFKGSFYDLNSNKKYYLRFYVKTNKKIHYGNAVSFESKKHNSPSESSISNKNNIMSYLFVYMI